MQVWLRQGASGTGAPFASGELLLADIEGLLPSLQHRSEHVAAKCALPLRLLWDTRQPQPLLHLEVQYSVEASAEPPALSSWAGGQADSAPTGTR